MAENPATEVSQTDTSMPLEFVSMGDADNNTENKCKGLEDSCLESAKEGRRESIIVETDEPNEGPADASNEVGIDSVVKTVSAHDSHMLHNNHEPSDMIREACTEIQSCKVVGDSVQTSDEDASMVSRIPDEGMDVTCSGQGDSGQSLSMQTDIIDVRGGASVTVAAEAEKGPVERNISHHARDILQDSTAASDSMKETCEEINLPEDVGESVQTPDVESGLSNLSQNGVDVKCLQTLCKDDGQSLSSNRDITDGRGDIPVKTTEVENGPVTQKDSECYSNLAHGYHEAAETAMETCILTNLPNDLGKSKKTDEHVLEYSNVLDENIQETSVCQSINDTEKSLSMDIDIPNGKDEEQKEAAANARKDITEVNDIKSNNEIPHGDLEAPNNLEDTGVYTDNDSFENVKESRQIFDESVSQQADGLDVSRKRKLSERSEEERLDGKHQKLDSAYQMISDCSNSSSTLSVYHDFFKDSKQNSSGQLDENTSECAQDGTKSPGNVTVENGVQSPQLKQDKALPNEILNVESLFSKSDAVPTTDSIKNVSQTATSSNQSIAKQISEMQKRKTKLIIQPSAVVPCESPSIRRVGVLLPVNKLSISAPAVTLPIAAPMTKLPIAAPAVSVSDTTVKNLHTDCNTNQKPYTKNTNASSLGPKPSGPTVLVSGSSFQTQQIITSACNPSAINTLISEIAQRKWAMPLTAVTQTSSNQVSKPVVIYSTNSDSVVSSASSISGNTPTGQNLLNMQSLILGSKRQTPVVTSTVSSVSGLVTSSGIRFNHHSNSVSSSNVTAQGSQPKQSYVQSTQSFPFSKVSTLPVTSGLSTLAIIPIPGKTEDGKIVQRNILAIVNPASTSEPSSFAWSSGNTVLTKPIFTEATITTLSLGSTAAVSCAPNSVPKGQPKSASSSPVSCSEAAYTSRNMPGYNPVVIYHTSVAPDSSASDKLSAFSSAAPGEVIVTTSVGTISSSCPPLHVIPSNGTGRPLSHPRVLETSKSMTGSLINKCTSSVSSSSSSSSVYCREHQFYSSLLAKVRNKALESSKLKRQSLINPSVTKKLITTEAKSDVPGQVQPIVIRKVQDQEYITINPKPSISTIFPQSGSHLLSSQGQETLSNTITIDFPQASSLQGVSKLVPSRFPVPAYSKASSLHPSVAAQLSASVPAKPLESLPHPATSTPPVFVHRRAAKSTSGGHTLYVSSNKQNFYAPDSRTVMTVDMNKVKSVSKVATKSTSKPAAALTSLLSNKRTTEDMASGNRDGNSLYQAPVASLTDSGHLKTILPKAGQKIPITRTDQNANLKKRSLFPATIRTGSGPVSVLVVASGLDGDWSDSNSEKAGLDWEAMDKLRTDGYNTCTEQVNPEIDDEDTDSDIENGNMEEQELLVLNDLLKSSNSKVPSEVPPLNSAPSTTQVCNQNNLSNFQRDTSQTSVSSALSQEPLWAFPGTEAASFTKDPEENDCFGLKIESVFSLSGQADSVMCGEPEDHPVDDTYIEIVKEDNVFNVRNSDLWKSFVTPCFVVLERLAKSDIAKGLMDNQSKCSQYCRNRTLNYLCNLGLLQCVNHPDISHLLVHQPKKKKLLGPLHRRLKTQKSTKKESPRIVVDGVVSSQISPQQISPHEEQAQKLQTTTQVLQTPHPLQNLKQEEVSESVSTGSDKCKVSGMADSASNLHKVSEIAAMASDIHQENEEPESDEYIDPGTEAAGQDVHKACETASNGSDIKVSKPAATGSEVKFSKQTEPSAPTYKSPSLSPFQRKLQQLQEEVMKKRTEMHSRKHKKMTECHTCGILKDSSAKFSPTNTKTKTKRPRTVMDSPKKISVTAQKQPSTKKAPLKTNLLKSSELLKQYAQFASSHVQMSPQTSKQTPVPTQAYEQTIQNISSHPKISTFLHADSQAKCEAKHLSSNVSKSQTSAKPQISVPKSSSTPTTAPTSVPSRPLPEEKIVVALKSLSQYLSATGRKVTDGNSQYFLLKIENRHVLVKFPIQKSKSDIVVIPQKSKMVHINESPSSAVYVQEVTPVRTLMQTGTPSVPVERVTVPSSTSPATSLPFLTSALTLGASHTSIMSQHYTPGTSSLASATSSHRAQPVGNQTLTSTLGRKPKKQSHADASNKQSGVISMLQPNILPQSQRSITLMNQGGRIRVVDKQGRSATSTTGSGAPSMSQTMVTESRGVYGDSRSALAHLPPNSSLLPQRQALKRRNLTEAERKAKRRILEAKYPLPPGLVIKSEPDDSEYETSANRAASIGTPVNMTPSSGPHHHPTGSQIIQSFTCARPLPAVPTLQKQTTAHIGNYSKSLHTGTQGVQDEPAQQYVSEEVEQAALNEEYMENDNVEYGELDEPPSLIDETTKSVNEDTAVSDTTDDVPPVLQPMFMSSSVSSIVEETNVRDSRRTLQGTSSVKKHNISQLNVLDTPASGSATSLLSEGSLFSVDSGFGSGHPSTSSSSSSLAQSSSRAKDVEMSLAKSSKIQQLKELLKRKQMEIESMRKAQSEFPTIDVDYE